jgi:hypothetical protein
MFRKSFLVVMIVSIFIMGCGATFTYRGETFNSSAEALKRQAEVQNDALSKIKPVQEPIGGKALIAIPSDNEIRKKHVTQKGRASEEMYSFMVPAFRNDLLFIVDAVRKSQMFDSLAVSFHNGNPHSTPMDTADYLIYADVDGWFVRGKKSSDISSRFNLKKYFEIKDLGQRTEAIIKEFHEQVLIIKNKK